MKLASVTAGHSGMLAAPMKAPARKPCGEFRPWLLSEKPRKPMRGSSSSDEGVICGVEIGNTRLWTVLESLRRTLLIANVGDANGEGEFAGPI